jgi:outer membrane protein assembly factor BamB
MANPSNASLPAAAARPAKSLRHLAILLCALSSSACTSLGLGSLGMPGDASPLTGPGRRQELGPLSPAWRRELIERSVYRDHVHQVGGVAHDSANGRVAVGTADGWYRCFDAADGDLLWEVEVGSGGGGRPVFAQGLLYTGTDDGRMLALNADNGRKVWSYRVQGAISREPVIVGGTLYFVDGENAIYALDAQTGAWRWQYRRELPAEFSLVGEASPRVVGDRVYVGFSDGMFAALSAADGGQVWLTDLAPEHDRFQDVDAQAAVVGNRVFAASAAAGLAILDTADGRVIETLPIAGVTALTPVGSDVLVALDTGHILRLDGRTGDVRWRTAFGDGSGAPAEPVLTGDYVLVPFSRGGMQVINATSGRPVHHFTPGNGIHGPITVGRDGSAWLLSDGGVLYSFRPR